MIYQESLLDQLASFLNQNGPSIEVCEIIANLAYITFFFTVMHCLFHKFLRGDLTLPYQVGICGTGYKISLSKTTVITILLLLFQGSFGVIHMIFQNTILSKMRELSPQDESDVYGKLAVCHNELEKFLSSIRKCTTGLTTCTETLLDLLKLNVANFSQKAANFSRKVAKNAAKNAAKTGEYGIPQIF